MRKLITLALLLIAGAASATISSGYYYVKSHNSKYLTENIRGHELICSDRVSGNYSQVWYLDVSGSNVTIKNALTERYVQGSTTTYEQWLTDANSHTFTLTDADDVYTFANSDNWGIHCDGSNTVVGWYISDSKSKWTVEAVDVDNAALTAQRDALTEATTEQLTNFFTTTACTALKSPYSGYSDDNLRSAMSALSTTVQEMAIKVKNNSWTTYSGWDKTEKTFRIADYKAYSSGDRWTSILGYKHHLGRLSNPTGIWADAGQVLQVYVGTIPSGESVSLEVAGYGQAAGSLYPLHEGMNSLLMATSGNCFVFFEVDNTTSGAAPYTLPSSYADVTVHIEGGTVQGYFDITKNYTDADWTQMKTHLLTDTENRPTVCLKTDKHVMNLGIERLIHALNGESIVDMLNVWRNLSQWEDELSGRSDNYGGQTRYGQYCNNIFSVTALPGSDGSPHASTYGTYYYDYSDDLIFNANALLTVADNMWCIAHEQGHNRQEPINLVGNTEVSNNVFSNLAVYNQGRFTSRTASIQETFRDYLDGISWPERVARANSSDDAVKSTYNPHLIHLNWQLYQFFHLNGNDPDFFPRLFDALRADPMTSTAGADKLTPANTDYLKFYINCCEVSGYDLTDFFAAYGFFMLPPEQATPITYNGVTTSHYQAIGDYGTYNLYVTQEMIDAAKSTVAAMNLPKCNIIFIEDRVTAPDALYEGHSVGEKRVINPDAPVKSFGKVGETGQYTDFGNTCSAYRYNVDEGYVTVEGTGAVGFIVYDNSGNIAGFYNTTSFKLPENLGRNYSIKAAAGDGTQAEMARDEGLEVVVKDFPRTDKWYTFRTTLRDNRYMLSNGVGEGVVGNTASTPTEAMQWRFVARTGDSGNYDIVNRADGTYLSPVAEWNTQVTTTDSQPATGWQVDEASTDDMYIIFSGETQLNQTGTAGTGGNKVFNWGYWYGYNTTDTGCQFTIEAVDDYAEPVYAIKIAASPAANLSTNTWYVMFDRGAANGYYHGYLYENESNTLYNTNMGPGLIRSDYARYLVRLSDAGGGKFYIETGRGNYLQALVDNSAEATPVAVTTGATKESFTIAKIASTDGHFYVQGSSNNVVLDANSTYNGDDTVVGYGTTVPTATGGNNDWAFYPVEFVDFNPTKSKVYTINNTNVYRGAMMYAPSQSEKWVWSSGKESQTFSTTDPNCQWIIVPTDTDGEFYLYNIGKHKFVAPTKSGTYSNGSGYSWMFSSNAVSVQLCLQSDGTFNMATTDGIYLSVSNNYAGPIINYSANNDPGQYYTITQQGSVSAGVRTQLFAALGAKPSSSYSQSLTAVNGKSYATLYLDYDVQTDEHTKAYYINAVEGDYAKLTEVGNEGRNIPAYTAVVLMNEEASTNATFGAGFGVSSGYADVVGEATNLLKGTLVEKELDLSQSSPYYSLGVVDKIGFYKFDNGLGNANSTTITLGANKAYLEYDASTGVKGFILDFGGEDGIGLSPNSSPVSEGSRIYDLSGRHVNTPSLGEGRGGLSRGVYIVGGRKVVVK